MSDYYIAGSQEITDNNGMRLFTFKIRNRNKKKFLERLMYDGIQIVSGAALAACTWKLNVHPIWSFGFTAMSIEGAVHFYKDIRRCFRKLSNLQKERIRSTVLLATGTITYFANVVAFSRSLKKNNKLWIPYLGVAAVGYFLSVWSNNRLGRTILNRKPVFKCCQLLFGPTLIGSAAYYLLSLQKHDEEWLRWLPLIASGAVANHISAIGHRRVESDNEPRWLLFKGLELLMGGSILCINGAVLFVIAVNNNFHQFITLIFAIVIYNGVIDILSSLDSFQGCVEMEEPVFYCICGMICGPIILFSACLSVICVDRSITIKLPVYIVISGIGLTTLGKSVFDLCDLVQQPVFDRYCRRVLGPVAIAYSTLASAYIGYRMGWRFSVAMMSLIPAGIYTTYRGWNE